MLTSTKSEQISWVVRVLWTQGASRNSKPYTIMWRDLTGVRARIVDNVTRRSIQIAAFPFSDAGFQSMRQMKSANSSKDHTV